ncbi:aldehyde dehydrogenase family protein [Haloarcula sp. JP-L23]|uniref:aldehyde dehydrogenase family protein n=1 Tax=Haloarcula sp. JP-L23 TaxID=2716717 RepID=UPI00140F0740|nr:aldehyde dehydrogenase family protein [Haloarcula sp. JP-L23]
MGTTSLPVIDNCSGMYIDGQWRSQSEAESIEITNPATGERLTQTPACTAADVDEAFAAVKRAQKEWAETPPRDRADVIREAISVLEEKKSEVRELLSVESGSAAVKTEAEFETAINHMEVAADHSRNKRGLISASKTYPGKENRIQRVPVGVVGVIAPWNFPLALALRAVAPALALGNGVVLKPAEETPLSGGLLLAQIFDETDLPDGLLNVVPGYGDEAGEAVVANPAASVVSFTGSTAVGRHVAKVTAERLAEPALELGGNNPYIVLDDADLSRAVDAAIFGSFMHQGQACISINRHLVHESIYDEYTDRLTARARQLKVGDPLDEDTIIGPVINEHQRDKLVSLVEATVEEGATIETGGNHDDLYVEPTVLSDVTNEMQAACTEHFGPIAPVIPFETDEEAIQLANDTEYGLSAAVQSSTLSRAERVAQELESGMVHINDQPFNGDPYVPFGGVKNSGIGRYNGDAIYRKFTKSKWTSIQRDPREYPF